MYSFTFFSGNSFLHHYFMATGTLHNFNIYQQKNSDLVKQFLTRARTQPSDLNKDSANQQTNIPNVSGLVYISNIFPILILT